MIVAQITLSELVAAAAAANDPSYPPPQKVKFGGIDPLGLRQINFDLMDRVLPGVNNVARHIRPFTVATWAWRRAGATAAALGKKQIAIDILQDFVARIEVVYVWSQFILDRNADLPGHDVFGLLLQSEKYIFDGPEWANRREVRRLSTAISSPINYGPALKTLGWVVPHDTLAGVMRANVEASGALDAFEAHLGGLLEHPAFNAFGPVSVTRAEAASWAQAWRLDKVTPQEKAFMRASLCGQRAPNARRAGMALMMAASGRLPNSSANEIRRAMCNPPSNAPLTGDNEVTAKVWKQVQIRQLFRLVLEALFYWIRNILSDGSLSTAEIVELFWKKIDSGANESTTAGWLAAIVKIADPVETMNVLNSCLGNLGDANLERTIASGIGLALRDSFSGLDPSEREDRLPLDRAQREAKAWGHRPPKEFVRHILESWILAQHVYWSVGRGLADARSRGKSILRLKIVLEEGGWTLTPGSSLGSPPVRAGDRLETVLSLANESALIS